MADGVREPDFEAAGSWAKRYAAASRGLMEAVLRPYDLGTSQWYVLYVLVHNGPVGQRTITELLDVERATLSGVIGALVRKGLVAQVPDPADRRRKTLRVTPAGRRLWRTLPDPARVIADVAFAGVSERDVATALRVLQEATERVLEERERRRTP